MSDHREAIAEVLAPHQRVLDGPGGCHCGEWPPATHDVPWPAHLADALLGSDVLAQIRAEARAEALREAAAMFRDDAAEAWGGDASWLTTGTRVASLAADWLDESAVGSA